MCHDLYQSDKKDKQNSKGTIPIVFAVETKNQTEP